MNKVPLYCIVPSNCLMENATHKLHHIISKSLWDPSQQSILQTRVPTLGDRAMSQSTRVPVKIYGIQTAIKQQISFLLHKVLLNSSSVVTGQLRKVPAMVVGTKTSTGIPLVPVS